ncbi:MAG: PP2C family protein-serine/threonine phosphatase, partial [Balneolaceae bacterium]|nr:PP2C family protein-serine/threonine phosphatase [Balneolaceae bacterium]
IAKSIQRGLLPDPIPTSEKLDIAATNISSYQVGGDYYDILETPSGNLLVAIGDVTGKGIPASLLMANLQSMLHVLLPIDITLGEASGRMNDIIYQNTPSDKFITFFWGLFDPEKSTFKYVNAGHNPPIFLKKDHEEVKLLEEGGLILGAMETMSPYTESDVKLESGDLLVCFTDGVTEAMNADETEEYGDERLIECIKKNRNGSAKDVQDAIVADVNEFANNIQYDDITLVVLKVN